MMKLLRFVPLGVCLALLLTSAVARSQVVINELVQDERSAGSGQIVDTREFIELYNTTGSAVNIGDWSVALISLDDGSEIFSLPLLPDTMIGANDFFVIGNSTGVPNVDYDLSIFGEVFPNDNLVYELRDSSASLVDALAVNITFDPQREFLTATQAGQVGGGWWGQILSSNTGTPQSLGRYIDGRDTNDSGRDFGMIPLTPGTSNSLPEVGAYVLPDIQALSLGSDVPGFSSSFVQPKVVDPTQVGTYIKHPITAPPQGSKAVVAWDQTGGGNMVATNSLVTSFDLNVYLDTEPLNVSTGDFEWEVTTYGIGTTDPFFASPDTNVIFTTATTTNNGNTGIGWLYEREEVSGVETLKLVDFGGSGNSLPDDEVLGITQDWTIIETIDMSATPSGWHRLAIDYDPATGAVEARFNDQVFTFNTLTDQVGTFYVGFREALSGGVPAVVGPPIFQQYIESAGEDADFNGDGSVDGQDFLIWQRGFGTGTTLAEGDADGDGTVDGDDLAIWQGQYGSSAVAAAGAVPEPGTAVLALCLFVASGVRRGRSHA